MYIYYNSIKTASEKKISKTLKGCAQKSSQYKKERGGVKKKKKKNPRG